MKLSHPPGQLSLLFQQSEPHDQLFGLVGRGTEQSKSVINKDPELAELRRKGAEVRAEEVFQRRFEDDKALLLLSNTRCWVSHLMGARSTHWVVF